MVKWPRHWSPVWITAGFLCGVLAVHRCQPRLYLNVSGSLPRGAYMLDDTRAIQRGDLVIAPLGDEVRTLFEERGYLPPGVPLMKPVVAMAGDDVCAHEDDTLTVNGRVLTPFVATTDSQGRDIPTWYECRTLGTDEVFVLSTAHPHSLDSRYIGPVARHSLRGPVTFLWGW